MDRGRPRRAHPTNPTNETAQWVFILLMTLVAIAALIIAIIGLAKAYNNRVDIRHTRRAVGFSAWTNDTQLVLNGTATIVAPWLTIGGTPAYDDSGYRASVPGFNETSGVFTCRHAATYIVVGTVCFTTTASTGFREARLVTSGLAEAIVFDRQAAANDTTLEFQCLGVHQVQKLAEGDMVWLEAVQSSGDDESLSPESRFSLERLGR